MEIKRLDWGYNPKFGPNTLIIQLFNKEGKENTFIENYWGGKNKGIRIMECASHPGVTYVILPVTWEELNDMLLRSAE